MSSATHITANSRSAALVTDWAPRALSLLRIVAALLFLEHGAQKLLGFPPPSAATGGMPAVFTLIWFAGVMELVGSLMLLAGVFTRPVAFLLSGEMAIAYWLVHAPHSPFPALNGGDSSILFCFIFLYLSVAGGGAWSFDTGRLRSTAIA